MAAADARIRVPVAVACRVLRLSTQGYYKWLKDPVSQRDWDDAHAIDVPLGIHEDDPTLGYRFPHRRAGRCRHHRIREHGLATVLDAGVFASQHRRRGKPASQVRRSMTTCSPSSTTRARPGTSSTSPCRTRCGGSVALIDRAAGLSLSGSVRWRAPVHRRPPGLGRGLVRRWRSRSGRV